MIGVILLSLSGIVFGLLSASDLVKKIIKSEGFERFLNRISKFDLIIGPLGIFVGIWNLFSPNFGFRTNVTGADLTILGATIPSALITLSGISISLHYLLQILNIPTEKKDEILAIRNQYADLVGVLTVIFSLLHLVTYQTILL
ncbi:MAG: hypothetical protein ABDH28_00525 [Brevinematia bacterium]